MTPTETVLQRLAAAGCNPRQSRPGQWTARCPNTAGHTNGDRHPSLSIAEGNDGAVVHCATGCPPDRIVETLGLRLADLFPPRTDDTKPRLVATYDYHDEEGTLVLQALRYEPKTFRQRQPDGRGGWRWTLQGLEQRPLYRLPQTLAAVAAGRTIWIAEGEKDVDALVRAGVDATCNPMGAGKWRPEHTEWLAAAHKIEIVADDDDTGHNHAKTVRDALAAVCGDVRLWLPHKGCKDVAEHLGQGRPLAELRPFVDDKETPPTRLRANLLLGPAILDLPPVDWLIHETIQTRGLTVIYGPPKSFKTFVTLDMVLHIANGLPWRDLKVRQARVLYVVAEGAPGVGPRARAWCQRFGGTLDNMAWLTVAPDLFNRGTTDDTIEVAEIAVDTGSDVVVVDTLARAMPGGDENSAKDMGVVVSHFETIMEHAGCGVMAVHHTGKDQTRGMRGSNSLQGAVDTSLEVIGDQYAVNCRVVDQKNAESDRAWWWKPVRLHPSLVLEPTQGLDATSEDVRDMNILRQLQMINATGQGVSRTEWGTAVKERGICGETTFKERLTAMAARGLVANSGSRQRGVWQLTVEGLRFVATATD